MMHDILSQIDSQELGSRLQQARKRAGLTQAAVAEALSMSRTTITAVEKGERKIKAEELVKLSEIYGRPVSEFVHPQPAIEIDKVQFRSTLARTPEDEMVVQPAIDTLLQLAANYWELEQITGQRLSHHYPLPFMPPKHLRTAQAAESLAVAERNRLGLGVAPVPILRDILEKDVGLRIFYLDLKPSGIFSEAYFYTPQLGGCIAINQLHAGPNHKGRCRWSLAHAYAHFLAHRTEATVSVKDQYQRKPESERFADLFAEYFLMPTSGLSQRFSALYQAQGKITPADLVKLAYYYGVSLKALLMRLENMRLIPAGVWEKLQQRKFKVADATERLKLDPFPEPTDKFPERYIRLAAQAYEDAQISEGELARYLQMDRVEAREIISKYEDKTEIAYTIDQDVMEMNLA
ncbi:MAG: ImmA/IrrE family metallo-endopeptidase [Anaerolineales bacterium]|nr:ImmA/IrrE family metallo-endopeptidase [Anaerolineales bacterium]